MMAAALVRREEGERVGEREENEGTVAGHARALPRRGHTVQQHRETPVSSHAIEIE